MTQMSIFKTREGLDFFNQLKKNYPHPVILVKDDGTILDFNQYGNDIVHDWDRKDFDALREIIGHLSEEQQNYPYYFSLKFGENTCHYQANCVFYTKGKSIIYFYDISTDARLRLSLIESRQRYKELVEISSEFAWETDSEGRFVFVSPKGAIGWTPESLIGYGVHDYIQELNKDNVNPFTSKNICEEVEVWFLLPNGKKACLHVDSIPIYDSTGLWHGARGVCHDVTLEHLRDSELARLQQRERLMTRITQAVRGDFKPRERLEQTAKIICNNMSLQFCAIQNFFEKTGFEDISSYGETQLEDSKLIKIKTYYHNECNGQLLIDAQGANYKDKKEFMKLLDEVAIQIAIMIEQMNYQEKLEFYSTTDGLTKLLNRRAFFDYIETRIQHAFRTGRSGALVYIDLDNFKEINDTQGHAIGDEVLIDFAQSLKRSSRAGDGTGRMGGDEFAMWLEEVDGVGAKAKAINIMDDCKSIFKHYSFNPAKPLGASIGIAVFNPKVGESVQELINRSDEIMYEVKHSGKGRIKVQELSDKGDKKDV